MHSITLRLAPFAHSMLYLFTSFGLSVESVETFTFKSLLMYIRVVLTLDTYYMMDESCKRDGTA